MSESGRKDVRQCSGVPEAGLEQLYPIRLSFRLPSSAASTLCEHLEKETKNEIKDNSMEIDFRFNVTIYTIRQLKYFCPS